MRPMISLRRTASFGNWFIRIAACAVVASVAFESCNHPFDPRGSLDRRLVVFSALSTDRVNQCVRVEGNYMPQSFDPLSYTGDNFIEDAVVTISDANATYQLRDTLFARTDTHRYTFPLRAYTAAPLPVRHGAMYTLTVQSPGYPDASASITVPAKPSIVLPPYSYAVLQSPTSFPDTAEIVLSVTSGTGAKGFIGRLYVCYSVLKQDGWVEERAEVPVHFVFPVTYIPSRPAEMSHVGYDNRSASVYTAKDYSATIIHISYDLYKETKVSFTHVVYELVQTESNLYDYFMVAHANQDLHSVRLDEPVFTNLLGGTGVVGAYTLDSLVAALPPVFFGNRQ